MRISVSLLVLCAAITGCNTSIDPANVDSIVVSSNPTSAAIRLNGEPVGRTPATIKVDRTKNYELQVGKGGFLTEVSELKPRLITTSEGIEFGFPASVNVNLTKTPAAGEAGVPVSDNPEFKKLSKKALGEDAAESYNGQQGDIWDAHKDMLLATLGSLLDRQADPAALQVEVDDLDPQLLGRRDDLLGQVDVHRLVALGVIGVLQGVPRLFDVRQGAVRSQIGIHRLFDGAVIEYRVATHDVLVDIDLRLALGQRGARQ